MSETEKYAHKEIEVEMERGQNEKEMRKKEEGERISLLTRSRQIDEVQFA